ncbi:hypothetical protein ACEQPO_06480 [Bacillus sp. SL00103]
MKVKQFLFRKGFDLDTIDHVLDKGNDRWTNVIVR